MRLTALAASIALGVTAVMGGTLAAQAQDDNAWVKICNRDPNTQKNLCLVTQELRSNSGQLLASLAIREAEGEARKSLLTSVPVGMLIRPNVRLQIDGGRETEVPYSICFPNACYAELAIDAGFVNQMKAGGKLQVTTMNQQAKPVRFDMTLIGFTAAYDGPGTDPAALQAKAENLQRQLEEKAQEKRNLLVAEQRKAIEDTQD